MSLHYKGYSALEFRFCMVHLFPFVLRWKKCGDDITMEWFFRLIIDCLVVGSIGSEWIQVVYKGGDKQRKLRIPLDRIPHGIRRNFSCKKSYLVIRLDEVIPQSSSGDSFYCNLSCSYE